MKEKLCETCRYRNNVEQLKPCIIYRDDCEYYEKERGDMTREEALRHLQAARLMLLGADNQPISDLYEALTIAIEVLEQEPKAGHWEWVQYDYNPKLGNWHCSECRCIVVECVDKEEKGGIPLYKYCPQCGAKMVEPQESEDKE